MGTAPTPNTPLARRALRTLGGAWAGGVLANLIFAIVDAPQSTRLAVALTLLVVGAIFGWLESRDAGPWRPGDVRDGAVGWAIIVGSIASVALPTPWNVVSGVAAFLLTAIFAIEHPTSPRAVREAD